MPDLPISLDILTILVSTSFIASLLTASVGIGGGTLVLAVLVVTVPITAVVLCTVWFSWAQIPVERS